ncbi:2-dehydro-3-deoxyglucarate aldolase [Noviherbaspirillum massiliense]|uniref:2-dehydro-3-deoxyglucarate aldolase n=1 Tax=Noviherbaspirillum massiliense TaxID=1465823 RepID=UPI0002FC3ABA|nr:2-dehydro-3-deoxyglucarate aldolase [Noviherbaspirillum massiliense]
MNNAHNRLPNRFRQRVLAGERLIGCWLGLADNLVSEVVGYAGFDWLLLDGEHAPNDLNSLVAQLQALKDSSSAPVVRPDWNEPVRIKRLLDIGFFNFLIPFVESAEQAQAAVSATRYPPQGIRGVSVANRGNRFGYEPDYFATINDNICVMAQIESRKGVDACAEIAMVDGIDCLFIGPSDLSAALGHFGQPQHPEVQEAIRHVAETARSKGKQVGILAPVEADAQRYLGMGIHVTAVGSDIGLLKNASSALCARFKK